MCSLDIPLLIGANCNPTRQLNYYELVELIYGLSLNLLLEYLLTETNEVWLYYSYGGQCAANINLTGSAIRRDSS